MNPLHDREIPHERDSVAVVWTDFLTAVQEAEKPKRWLIRNSVIPQLQLKVHTDIQL